MQMPSPAVARQQDAYFVPTHVAVMLALGLLQKAGALTPEAGVAELA